VGYNDSVESGIRYTLRGLFGQVLREYFELNGSWSWVKDHIWAGGELIATVEPSGIKHLHRDHLGSVRLETSGTGAVVATHSYWPFGEEMTVTSSSERYRFAGHERDQRTGYDSMHARYYAAMAGRFFSVDPGRDYDFSHPQSFNLYAYVRNDLLTFVDKDGQRLFKVLDDKFIELLWSRWKHIFKRHVKKDTFPHKSKFEANDPKEVKKLIENTVRRPLEKPERQNDARLVYKRYFNKEVGTEGEKGVKVLTKSVGEGRQRVITAYPIFNFLLSLVPGMWAADAADAAVEGAKLGAETLETMVNQGPVGQHRRALDWANSLEDPSAEDLP
jgi:RHS repeat-associated protein